MHQVRSFFPMCATILSPIASSQLPVQVTTPSESQFGNLALVDSLVIPTLRTMPSQVLLQYSQQAKNSQSRARYTLLRSTISDSVHFTASDFQDALSSFEHQHRHHTRSFPILPGPSARCRRISEHSDASTDLQPAHPSTNSHHSFLHGLYTCTSPNLVITSAPLAINHCPDRHCELYLVFTVGKMAVQLSAAVSALGRG